MKQLLKKGLSLLLAVLMVTSALPMNVLAASVAESRREAAADTGDVYSTGEDTRPPQEEAPDEIGDDTGDIEKDDAEDPAGEPEDAARPETPADDGANGESAGKKEQTEKPDPDVGDDDPPVEPLWDNWSMEFISIDPDTGDFVIEITGGSKADSGDFALTVLPRMRSSSNTNYKVPDEVTQVTGSTVGPALQSTLATRTGLSTAVMWNTDMSRGTNIILDDNGKARIEGSFGMSNGELAALLGNAVDVKGNKVNPDAIPIVAVLTTQGGTPGKVTKTTTMGGAAVLRVDPNTVDQEPDTIVLAGTAVSFQFDVQHTSVSTEDANIQNIKWVGTNAQYVGNGAGLASLETGTVALIESNLDGSRKTIHVSLSGNANQRGAYLGDVIIEYNSTSLTRLRTLVVHVITEPPMDPIRITVVAGGPAVAGGTTMSGGPYVPIDPTDDTFMDILECWEEGKAPDPSGVTSAAGSDGIELKVVKSTFMDFLAAFGDPEAFDPDEPGGYLSDGDDFSDIVTARADESVKAGSYTAGYVTVVLLNDEFSVVTLEIPIIVTVIEASAYSAIFSGNGGSWAEGESSVATKTVSTYDLPGAAVGTAKPADPTRSGYSFKGWATASSGTTAADALGDGQLCYSSDPTDPNMYYAIWEMDNTTVKFDPKDGTTATTKTGVPGTAATAPTGYTAGTTKKTISGASYKFAGWSETEVAPGNTATTTSDFKFPSSGTKTYYGVWTEQTTITYDVNWPTATGTIGPAPNAPGADTGDKGRTIDTTANTLALTDAKGQYTFGGWYTEATGTNAAGNAYKADANATLYAKWTPVTHKVTYDAGATSGVSGLPTPNPVTGILHATSHTISTTEPTRSGYTFTGWKSDVSEDTTVYKTGTTNNAITVNADITLTATWSLDDTTVKFDPKDGTTATTKTGVPGNTTTAPTGYTAGTTVKTISGTSYKFAGWSETEVAPGNTATTTSDFKFPDSGTKTYYGVWTEQTTITYNVNWPTTTGTIGPAPAAPSADTGDKGRTIDTTDSTLALTDAKGQYTFGGWYTEATGTNAAGDAYKADANATLYAKWTPVTHTVTYDAGATSGVSGLPTLNPVTGILHATSHTISATEPTRSGYTFTGWKSNVTGDTNNYKKDGTGNEAAITVNADITLTAQWEAITNTVKYTDPAGSGATMPGNATITAGAVTLSAPTSVPTGWTFVEWKVQGDTTTYTGTQALTGIVGDLTLEAQWTVDVTYVSTYGTAPSNLTGATAVLYNTDITVGAITAKTGDTFASDIYTDNSGSSAVSYRFNGWTASPAANISKTTVGATDATVTGPVTLTAGWVGQSSVKFDLNGGTLATGKTVPGDQSGDVSTAIPNKPTATATTDVTKAGYTFGGWAKNKNNGTASDAVNVANIQFPTTAGATDTYYAIWTINTYTVTFKRNHSASDTTTHATKTTNYNTSLGSSNYPADPSRTGYTFGGWYPNQDGTGTAFTNATVVIGDTTVYAKWTANTYDVTYAVGKFTDGRIKAGESPQTVTYDDTTCVVKASTIVEAQTGKSMTGWNFVEWNAKADGTGTTWAVSADLSKITAAMTLTAQWTVNVDFKANIPTGEDTATGNPSSVADPGVKTAPAGKAVTNFPGNLAALANYTFTGWNTKADGSGTAVTSATTFDAPATVYAQWKAKTYTVSFVDNSGDDGNPADEADKNYGSSITLPASSGDKVGYTFDGWYKESALTNPAGDVGDSYTVTKTEILYGKWSPADVTIVYQTDVGTAPGSDTKKYDATDYTAKNKNTITATGAGWNTGETIFTDDSGNRWQFNGWDILKADGSVLKQVNSAAAINPVNTTNGVVKTTADGKDTYTLTLKANWTQLFTITYAAGAYGTITTAAQPTSQINVVAGKYNTAYPSSGTTKAEITGGTWETPNGIFTIGNDHWQFTGWSDGTTTYNAGQQITISSDVTLTAQWATRYKITLAPAKRPSTTITDNIVSVNVGSGTTLTSNTTNSTYVSGSFALSSLTKVDNPNNYIFVQWTATKTVGGDATTGTFTNGATGTENVTTDKGDTFDPKEDTTLTPTFALRPTLEPTVDGYQLNFPNGVDVGANDTENQQKWQYSTTNFKKAKNTLPTYTWTAGDATIGDVTITAPAGVTLPGDTTAGGTATLTPGTEYTYNATTGDIQFQRAYLLSLEATQKYTVTVKSTTNGEDTKRTADLWAVVTPDDLIKVVIGVKPDQAADYEASPVQNATLEANRTKSASVTDTNRNVVKYLDHEEITIIPGNLLTYQWYYADAPVEDGKRGPAGTLAGLPALPTGATQIGTSTTNNNVNMDNDDYKGKYIFATVVATGTGKNAVVTNSIPVDYDAAIKVTKDGNLVDNTTDAQGYKVYLVKKGVTPALAASNDALTEVAGSVVATTYDATNKVYKTAASTLTGGEEYTVYVNKVEDNFTKFENTNVAVTTQVNANAAKEVKFFSVNAVETDLKHAKDKSDTPQEVGESFGTDDADAPITEFYAEGVTAKFNSGKGVLTGSKVTAKASKTWTQDYDVNWGMKEDAGTTAPALTYVTDNQTATNAVGIGKNYTNIKAKTWIGAQLEQNTYTITGNVWVNDYSSTGAAANAGIDASTGKTPTLTYTNTTTSKTYTFTSTVNSNGVHKSTVTFAGVPRSGVANAAIDGQYVVKATEKSSNTKSTIIKYIPGQNVATASDTSIAGVNALTNRTLAADIPAGGVTAPQFTVVLAASVYSLQAADQEGANKKTATHTLNGTPTVAAPAAPSGNRLATQPWTGTFAGITAKTYTIDVTNEGNMPLVVSLNIKRTMGSTDVYVYGANAAGTDDLTAPSGGVTVWTDSDNNVTFGALQESFTLAPKGSTGDKVTFTVTVPADLTVNNAADYAFELTSKEGELYGPSVTYKLTQKVNPRSVTKVAAGKSGSTLTASGLEIDNSASIPSGVTVNEDDAASGDVVYEWYAVSYGSKVDLNASGVLTVGNTAQTSISSGKTYIATASEAGKDVYVVARGVGMSGNVLSAAKSDAITMPYDLKIQVNEDSTPTASKDNYTVYLWPTDGGTFNAATAIAATATAEADGRYLASGLEPGKTYDVYTNAVGSAHSNYQKSGTPAKLSDFTGSNVPVVTYRSVTINNTTTDNSPYSFANSSTAFIKDANGSTSVLDATTDGAAQKPTAALKADASVLVATTDTSANRWVQQGTEITVTYPAWGKDYDLTWDVGDEVTDEDNPATGDVKVDASTTIDSKLTLNLYEINAHVVGKGDVTEITLTGTDLSFTSIAAHDGLLNGTGGNSGTIQQDQSVTFKVPKGTYSVTGTPASGTTPEGYRKPHKAGDLTDHADTLDVTAATDTSFDVVVSATGKAMTVTDNATTLDSTTTTGTGTARFINAEVQSPTVTQTIKLPYGYSASTLTLTVSNTSPDEGEIFQVKMNDPTLDASGKITVTGPGTSDIQLDGTADMALNATTPVTVNIATGLEVGDYDSELSFAYNAVKNDTTNRPELTYKLRITVVPTKFTAVTVSGQDASGNVALGDALSFATYTTEDVDDWTNGKHLTADEYTYQWYHGPADKTATESWSAGTATVKDATAITGATGATLAASEIAKYPGEKIYLVISAVKDKNVIEAAISAPVTTGFQPVVKVSVDGTDQSTVSGFDGTDYTATIDDGTTTWNTVWSDDRGGFVPVDGGKEVSLDATKTYTAKVSRVKGDSTNLVALDDKLSNTSTTNTVTAPYFTVNAVETKAFEGITGLGEDFGGDDELTGPAVSFTLGGTALTNGTPVLSGQSVTATTATWDQDYELTWYTRMDGDTTEPTRDTAYKDTGATMTKQTTPGKVDSDSASGAGYTVSKVTNKLYVGGRLDQITYSVIGTVAGTGTVKSVALEQTADKTASYIHPETTPATSPVKPTSTSSASDGSLVADETVTFTVVKGTFTITPTEGANTVIKKVSWEGVDEADGVTVLTGKKVELKDTDPKRTYNFVITVEGADVKLKVSDDATTSTSAESNPNSWKDAKNGVERYFNYIHKSKDDSTADDVYEYELTLTNAGNKDVKVNAEVYHFDAAPAPGFGENDDKWTATKAAGKKVYETADGATATLTGASTKTVLSLSEMMAADTIVAAKDVVTNEDGSAKAGVITLGEDAWRKDTGAYVFHFMGVTNDDDATQVDVYYVLDLTINQLPIVEVKTNNSGAMVGVGETITAKGYDADDNKSLNNVTVKTSTKPDQTNAKAANLTGDDVHFAWVKVDAGDPAPAKADLSVVKDGTNDGTLASTVGTVVSQSESYTLVDGDQDSDFYLVAFAPNYDGNVTNATDMAIAEVVEAKRTVGVKVTLDTLPVNSAADPGYVIYLVEQGKSLSVNEKEDGSITLGEGTWATTWNGTDRYQAAIDTAKTYEVYAVTYKGGATVLKAITDTLGGAVDEVTVPYFSVNFTEDLEVNNASKGFKSYLPDGDPTTNPDNQIQEALSVKVSTEKAGTDYETAPLTTSGTPVLSGMNVKVTVDAKKSSKNTTDGVKNTWSEEAVQPLHTLTTMGWRDTNNKTSGITYADSIASGDIAVTEKKTFSAKLEQVRFTVKFTVQDISTDETGALSPSTETALQIVTLTPRGENATATGTKPSVTANAPGYKHGDTVTINNVPMGDYTVSATKYPGSPTLVTGYTWNDATTEDKDGDIVVVSADKTKNEDTTGNTIRMLKATKVVNWYDTFDVNTGGLLADNAFVDSNGFQKVDDTAASPKKLFGLTEGYAGSKGDVLTYTVRAMNGGTDAMKEFYLTSEGTDLDYDLTDVKHCRLEDDGTVNVLDEHLDATTPFELGGNEYVEFTVTILEGKTGQKAYYTTKFIPHCYLENTEAEDLVTKQSYDPAYQVKTPVEFTPGEALVRYGGSVFEDHTDIAWKPFTSDEDTPSFTYKILELDGTDDAAILAEINDKLGLSLTTIDDKPSWLTADANGKITIPTGAHATGVNVKVNGTPADFTAYEDDDNGHKVKGEITLYIKATDTTTDETYIIPYVVDVEPGQLQIVDGSFTYTQADAVGGQDLDKSKFTYTKVTNDDAAPLDVIAASDIAGGKNTALGNTTAKDGKVNVDDTHTATWTLDPEKYVSDVSTQHIFTVTYKPLNDAEKWNYKPDTYTETITASRPALGLTFGDVLGKSSIETDPAAELKIGRAPEDGYSEILTDDNAPYAPTAMEHTDETYRKGEYIIYLDTEPKYTVTLTATGNLHDVEVEEELTGFKVVKGDILRNITTLADGEKKVFELELDALDANGKWVGEHRAWYKVTGTGDSGETTSATYELVFRMDPKVIAEAHVTDLTDPEPGTKPDTTVTVTAKDPEGEDIKPGTPDKHGNTPITPTVTWTEGGKPVDPTKDFEDGKDYTVTVELPADPNYVYEDKTPEGEEPNYTAGDKEPDPTYSEPEVTHKVDEGDSEKVTLTKTTELPKKSYLMFDDARTGGQTGDPAKLDADKNLERETFTVVKGQKLGVYTINLGAYDETVTDVTVTETGKDLPGAAVWSLTASPDSVGDLYNVWPDTLGDKKVYTLDLSGVDTSTLTAGHTYTLALKAAGFDPYGTDVFATYKMSFTVLAAPVPVLKFDDARVSAGSSNDRSPATLGPDPKVERGVITVTQGDRLGRYTVKLDAYGNTASEVYLELTTNITSGDKIYQLMDDTTLMKLDPSTHLTLNSANTALKPWTFDLDLSSVDTSETGEYVLTLTAYGKDLNNGGTALSPATYTLTIRVNPKPQPGGGGGGGSPACPNQVTYLLGLHGITKDATMEMVSGSKVKAVPNVTALEGYKFLGWSLVGPTGKEVQDAKRALVDPLAMSITGDTVFYAVYQPLYKAPEPPIHKHYVIGYPNGNFGPADNITRGSVATIIARAVLPNFVEGADYGNPGGYSDVAGNWAESAIAYCSKYGVFKGYDDGTFRPSQSITRQELALVVARLNGIQTGGTAPFTDIGDAGEWAKDGIYTAYINGWVNGYTDGSFKPLNPIRRDETVKIFNAFLHRGVNAEGLGGLTEYVHTGVASNNTGNGTTEYMVWPDVPKDHWAYYEIIEAANDHEFAVDNTQPGGYAVPEQWTKSWIDARWRYHDDANDGGSSAVVSGGVVD